MAPRPAIPATSMLHPKRAAAPVETGADWLGALGAEGAGVVARVEFWVGIGAADGAGTEVMTIAVLVGASGWPSEDSLTTGTIVVTAGAAEVVIGATEVTTTAVEVGASGCPSED
jgi:hypothetical protein